MGDVDINTLTVEQYLALTRGNQAPGVDVKTAKDLTLTKIVRLVKKLKASRKLSTESSDDPFPNNYENGGRYGVGPPGYYTRMDNQPPSGGRIPIKALTGEVEGRPTKTKQRECKAIFTKEGLPLYTLFYYSPEEIEYFSYDSSLSDEEVQEEAEEAEEINYETAQREPTNQLLTPRSIDSQSYGKSQKNKNIRQTDDYAKHMKNLVENILRTSEDEDVKMNTRCSAILQNQLPPMEQDPWSFTLPCSIVKLTFNALGDLGASISVMPLSMFKRLGIEGLKPTNMTIEIAYRTQSTPKGIAENLLIKIDKFFFLVDFVILNMVEDFRISIILGRPLMATTHAKVDIFRKPTSLEVRNQKVIFKTKNDPNKTLFETVCAIRNEKSFMNDELMKIDHDLFLYNSKSCIETNEFNYLLVIDPDIFSYEVYEQESWDEVDYKCSKLDQGKSWENEAEEETNREREIDLSSVAKLKEHWCKAILQQKGDDMTDMNVDLEISPNTREDCEDLENFRDEKMELILDNVLDELEDKWFSETVKDEDDLDGIVDYLVLKSYDGFIDVDNEAYKKIMCELLGLTYKMPPPILIKKVEVTRYIIGLGECYTKGRILQIDELPRTSTNTAAIRAKLIKEMDTGGSVVDPP
ncbi:zinc knuckle CX2CX4HX4C containing protein [Tanacetum coccineum]